jgi:ADP-ribose pyrophosphatase YjhB (NUDIX family)
MCDCVRRIRREPGIAINDEGSSHPAFRPWEPPGSVLGLGETGDDDVIREVLEETGVKGEVSAQTSVYKNATRGTVALVLACTMIDGEPGPTGQSVAV